MRILLDAHMIGQQETGNETYIINLLDVLSQLPDIQCAAVVAAEASIPEFISQRRIELIPLKYTNNWMRLLYELSTICQKWRADVVHTTYITPFRLACASVITVHDVNFKRYPNFFSPRDRLLFATLLPWSMKRANAVITVSEHARKEIQRFYPFTQNKVFVTLEAASRKFQIITDAQKLEENKAKYDIAKKFILAVGNLQPRKNLLRLIKAFALIHTNFPEYRLVVVGKAQWRSSDVFHLVRQLNLEDLIVFTGYVPDDDLCLLYNSASVFVYPSLYEGFGLPVLEAMACGTPVIASNLSSIPEVTNDAAILINPYDVNSIAEAIIEVLNDQTLSHQLVEKGIENVSKFSWQETARATVKVYKNVLKNTVLEKV